LPPAAATDVLVCVQTLDFAMIGRAHFVFRAAKRSVERIAQKMNTASGRGATGGRVVDAI
jgi:hypothetical protein